MQVRGGGELLQVDESDIRCRGASQVEGSDLKWRAVIAGGGERSQVEGSDLRQRALRGERSQGGWERSQVEESDRRWRGAISGGGQQSQVEGKDRRWRGTTSASVGQAPGSAGLVTLPGRCRLCTDSFGPAPA